jgi:uncharacterized protein YceK
MKKIALIIIVLTVGFILSGCGQTLNFTVYNATGVTNYGGGWVAIDIDSEGQAQWLLATGTALTETDCNSTNSLSVKVKENDTVSIGGNGEYSTDGTPATLTTFTLPKGQKTVYGGFLDQPAWYAAVNMDSVIFYTK